MFNYNPYTPYQYNPQPTQPVSGLYGSKQEIVKVNGEGGARAYQMPPNSSALLLDEMEPVVWLKTTDGAGYPNITPYVISPKQEEKHPDIRSLEERISRLEGMMNNESYYTNASAATNEQSAVANSANKKYDTRKKS